MAIDVYLQIEGIKGESADHSHRDWIECRSVQWQVLQPKSATASTSGGPTAQRTEHQDIRFQKAGGLRPPAVPAKLPVGKTIPRAKVEFLRADGNGERIKYFEIELENVLI